MTTEMDFCHEISTMIEQFSDEVLVLIFKYLDKTDIENCAKVCLRWKRIVAFYFFNAYLRKIAKMYKNLEYPFNEKSWTEECKDEDLIIKIYKETYSGRIFVASNNSPTEIIDIFDPAVKWKSPVDPKLKWLFNTKFNENSAYHVMKDVGGLIKNKIIICAGRYCYIFGIPIVKKLLMEPRHFASSVVINDSMLWIVGGKDRSDKNKNKNTSEFVKLNENPAKGPDFPVKISCQSMIQYDKKSVYIIGGFDDDYMYGSKTTWIADPSNGFQIQKGPDLNVPRHTFACGKMMMNGKSVIIVAGGLTKSTSEAYLDSVEILDPSSNDGWIIGNY